MVWYYFHIRNGHLFTCDVEGTELVDVAAAFVEARAMARDLAIDDLRQADIVADRMIDITTAAGVRVGTLRARDILEGDDTVRLA